MDYQTILYETDGGKARITLNRPDKLNAISWQMQQELRDALWAADRDPQVHITILRGAGRAFSSGYDITPPPGELTHAASAHSMERDIWYLEQAQQMRMALWDMHKPVIGQVHGYCLAGGTDLVFLCDIVSLPRTRGSASHRCARWARRSGTCGPTSAGRSGPSACYSPAT